MNAGVGVGSLAREGVWRAENWLFRPVKPSLLSAFFRFPTSPFSASAALSISSFFSSPSLSAAIVCLATFAEASPNFAGVPSTRSKVVLKAGKLGVPPTLGRGAATRRTVSTLGGGVKGVISGGGGDGGSGMLAAWESWDDIVEGKEVAVVDIDVGGVEVVLREVKPKEDTIDFNDNDAILRMRRSQIRRFDRQTFDAPKVASCFSGTSAGNGIFINCDELGLWRMLCSLPRDVRQTFSNVHIFP